MSLSPGRGSALAHSVVRISSGLILSVRPALASLGRWWGANLLRLSSVRCSLEHRTGRAQALRPILSGRLPLTRDTKRVFLPCQALSGPPLPRSHPTSVLRTSDY